MNIVEVREETELAKLGEEWNRLLAESCSDTIFLTWEWVTSWWRCYGEPGALRILLAYDSARSLRGIAPVRAKEVRRYGRAFRTLRFVGDGSNDSDYLDFIVAPGFEAEVVGAFLQHWEAELSRGLLLELSDLPETSANLAYLRSYAHSASMVTKEQTVVCGAVPLASNFQDYLKTLAPRFRTKIRSVLRNLEGNPEVKFHCCQEPSQLGQLLPSLYELHARRWQKDGEPGVFGWDKKRQFYEVLSPLLLKRGWLSFVWMEWRGRVLACQYGFEYRNTYFHLQEGYDPDCEHWSLGIALRGWSIQTMLERGVREYDFLAGMGRHKSDWGASTKTSTHLLIGRPQFSNLLYAKGPAFSEHMREIVKQAVPRRLLAVRSAHLKRRRELAVTPAESASFGGAWKEQARDTLAKCYFHSPLPALLPALRKRYSLQFSMVSGRPSIGWRKRQGPSARILYYHRVNDESDPFFPATPTRIFEEQVRFVARHYRVVSLSQVVKRLSDGGPNEPVVAVTFDDGYEDNYRCAFPILQRLGLTGTIFLTTGGIDSREPLWFEQLALAIKQSEREFIDVEMNVPRRLWMRTQAERLRANGDIYTFARQIPDAERKIWLAAILDRLGTTGTGERKDKMLTWEQIRTMYGNGIEFGGHTVNHPFSSKLLPEELQWEVSECKSRIEQELQVAVKHFAYPSGREQDVADWNKQTVREAGYEAAVSTLWGINDASTDVMELRRGQPWEDKLPVFAAKLDWYQLSDK